MQARRISAAAAAALVALATLGAAGASAGSYTGRLEIRHADDFRHDRASTHYTLLGGGRSRRLSPTRAPRILSGARVRVHGRRTSRGAIRGPVRALAHQLRAASIPAGPRKLAVILINFSNDTSQPWTPAQAKQIVFTNPDSTNGFYQEESHGDVSLVGREQADGDVFGWYTIAASSATCDDADVDTWASQARAAAAADGHDLSGYQHVMYVFPHQSSCNWAGLGELPGTQTWINGELDVRVTAHELGHNMGLHHASSYRCTSGGSYVAISSTCSAGEYGDPFDVMGMNPRHNGAWHLDQLGLMSASNVQTVGSSGTYTVTSAMNPGSSPQLLRIPRAPLGSGRGAHDYYDLELRTSGGVFDNYLSTAPVVNGVLVHVDPDPSVITQSLLIDTTPGSAGGFTDAALLPGHSFSDGNTTITTTGVSGDTATVNVTLGAIPDTTAPSAPSGLAATADASGAVLRWNPSSDDTGVAGYRVLRDGRPLGSTSATAWFDGGLQPGRTYGYNVVAYDAAGNTSSSSPTVYATMPQASTPPPANPGPVVHINSPGRGARVKRKVTVRASATDPDGVTYIQLTVDAAARRPLRGGSLSTSVRLPRGRHTIAVRAYDANGRMGSTTVRIRVVR